MQTGAIVAVDRKPSKAQKADIRKRLPLEQAIAEQSDRRVRWEAKRKEQGFVRTSFIVHQDALEQVKAFVREANATASAGPCHD